MNVSPLTRQTDLATLTMPVNRSASAVSLPTALIGG